MVDARKLMMSVDQGASQSQVYLQTFLRIAFPVIVGFLVLLMIFGLVTVVRSNLSSRRQANLYFLLAIPWCGMIVQTSEWIGNVWAYGILDQQCYWWALYWFGRPLFSLPVYVFSLRLTILMYGCLEVSFGGIRLKKPLLVRQARYGAVWMLGAVAVGMLPFLVIFPPLCVEGIAILKKVDGAHVALQALIILLLITNLALLNRRQTAFMQHHVTATMMKGMTGLALTLIYGILLDNVGWAFLSGNQTMTGGLLVFINYASQSILMFYFWWQTYRSFQTSGRTKTTSEGGQGSGPTDVHSRPLSGRLFQERLAQTYSITAEPLNQQGLNGHFTLVRQHMAMLSEGSIGVPTDYVITAAAPAISEPVVSGGKIHTGRPMSMGVILTDANSTPKGKKKRETPTTQQAENACMLDFIDSRDHVLGVTVNGVAVPESDITDEASMCVNAGEEHKNGDGSGEDSV